MILTIVPVTTPDGIDRWLQIHNAAAQTRMWSPEELAAYRRTLRESACVLASVEDHPLGAAMVALERRHRHVWHAPVMTWISVDADHRGAGVGSALYTWAWEWARARDKLELELWVDSDDGQACRFVEHRAFSIVDTEPRLRLALSDVDDLGWSPPSTVRVVPSTRVTNWIGPAYDLYADAAQRSGASGAMVDATIVWGSRQLAREEMGLQTTHIAYADGIMVGIAIVLRSPSRRLVGSHAGTYVRSAWQGRGIATALKLAQLSWAKESGVHHLEARVERTNTAKAKLYHRLGYNEIPGWVIYSGPA